MADKETTTTTDTDSTMLSTVETVTLTFWDRLKNFMSRKFLAALSGVIMGIVSIVQGETLAGCGLIGASVLGYLAVEGYIDAKSAAAALTDASTVLNTVSGLTETDKDDIIAGVVSQISSQLETAISDIKSADSATTSEN